jgi:hypothetical protein
MKPKLAAFPKCYMDELCVHRPMTIGDWIEMGAKADSFLEHVTYLRRSAPLSLPRPSTHKNIARSGLPRGRSAIVTDSWPSFEIIWPNSFGHI